MEWLMLGKRTHRWEMEETQINRRVRFDHLRCHEDVQHLNNSSLKNNVNAKL